MILLLRYFYLNVCPFNCFGPMRYNDDGFLVFCILQEIINAFF